MEVTVRALRNPPAEAVPVDVTLLELVSAVSDVANNEHEVVATVLHMLRSGSVRLCGCLRDVPVEDLFRSEIAECECVSPAQRAAVTGQRRS